MARDSWLCHFLELTPIKFISLYAYLLNLRRKASSLQDKKKQSRHLILVSLYRLYVVLTMGTFYKTIKMKCRRMRIHTFICVHVHVYEIVKVV